MVKKVVKKAAPKVAKSHLFAKMPRDFGIGKNIQPKKDLGRMVRWPKYVKLQRQKRILLQRLKVPPTINQFTSTLDKNNTSQLKNFLSKYKPESAADKKTRLSGDKAGKAPAQLSYGVNKVVNLIEKKEAKLVVIAHDVDPIELVLFLPALCRKKDVPFCIVKSKAAVGQMVGLKTTSCCAVTEVRGEDKNELSVWSKTCKDQFNDNVNLKRKWGGGIVGKKSQDVQDRRAAALAKEIAKKAAMA